MNKNKAVIFALIGLLLASSLSVAIEFASALPMQKILPKIIPQPLSNRLLSTTWVRINGVITQWGTNDVRGILQTQARTGLFDSSVSKALTSATAIWTTNLTREISAARSKMNFTYVYYVARLPNASISTSNVNSGSSYFLDGTWNISKVISTITVITNEDGTITKVHRDIDTTPTQAHGELTVTGTQFTLNIDGQDQLSGPVFRSIVRSWFNPFKLTDDSTTNIVTKADVKAVAQSYGASPGWGNYDTKMDFNNNYRVDIADISTVAANT